MFASAKPVADSDCTYTIYGLAGISFPFSLFFSEIVLHFQLWLFEACSA